MNDKENRPLPNPEDDLTKPDGFGNLQACPESRPERIGPSLLSAVARERLTKHCHAFATKLKHDPEFATVMNGDPVGFRAALVARVRAEFRSRMGRPPHPRLNEAKKMYDEGMTVTEILRKQFEGFDRRDPWDKMLSEKQLYRALSRRKKPNSKRARKSPAS